MNQSILGFLTGVVALVGLGILLGDCATTPTNRLCTVTVPMDKGVWEISRYSSEECIARQVIRPPCPKLDSCDQEVQRQCGEKSGLDAAIREVHESGRELSLVCCFTEPADRKDLGCVCPLSEYSLSAKPMLPFRPRGTD